MEDETMFWLRLSDGIIINATRVTRVYQEREGKVSVWYGENEWETVEGDDAKRVWEYFQSLAYRPESA